eukprot:jgi/Botrbrau1/22938/Bobra.0030s0015.1
MVEEAWCGGPSGRRQAPVVAKLELKVVHHEIIVSGSLNLEGVPDVRELDGATGGIWPDKGRAPHAAGPLHTFLSGSAGIRHRTHPCRRPCGAWRSV